MSHAGRASHCSKGVNHHARAKCGLAAFALLSAVQATTAGAADPASQFLVKLFTAACIPNFTQPTKVREWAQNHNLAEIHDPVPLGVFVGPGDKGAAWAVPAAEGSFALSLRGTTGGCAVWARAADPGEALAMFKKIVEGTRRPGVEVTIEKDTVAQGPVGEIHALAYNVKAPNAPSSFVFLLLTAERAGAAFQVSMQAAQAGPRAPPAK